MKRITLGVWLSVGMVSVAVAGELTVDILKVNQEGNFYGALNVTPAPTGSVPTNGLVVRFDFATNTTSVPDLSGNNNTGFVYGASWTNAGAEGGGFYFDGVNDYIQIIRTPQLNILGQMTIAFWMKPVYNGNYPTIIAKNKISDSTTNAYWNLSLHKTGLLEWYVNTDSQMSNTEDYFLKGWTHIVIVHTNTTSYLYQDGVLIADGGGDAIPSCDKDILIGRNNRGYYFKGVLDELAIYNRALSASEILGLYYATGTFTNTNSGTVTVSNTLTVANAIIQENSSATNVFMGKLGVGTNQPNTLLDVNGDATVRGALTVSGAIGGSGSGISGLDATNLSSGTVPLARLSGITSNQMDSTTDAAYRNAANPGVTNHAELSNLSYAAAGHTGFQPAGDYLTNNQSSVTLSGTFSGTGTGLAALNADNLSAGTVAVARLSGITTNQMAETERIRIDQAITNNQTGVALSGTFSGSGSGVTNLSAANLSSGTVPLARLSGVTTNNASQIDSGTLAEARIDAAIARDSEVTAATGALAKVAHTGAYGDLSGTPSIPITNGLDTVAAREAAVAASTQTIAGASVSGAVPYATGAGTAAMATNALQLGGVAAANYVTQGQANVVLSHPFAINRTLYETSLTMKVNGTNEVGFYAADNYLGVHGYVGDANSVLQLYFDGTAGAILGNVGGAPAFKVPGYLLQVEGSINGNAALFQGQVHITNGGSLVLYEYSPLYAYGGGNVVTNGATVTNALQLGGIAAASYLTNNQTSVTLSGTFSGTGAGLADLNASNLSSGTVPLARLSGVTTNNASQIDSGTLAEARIDAAIARDSEVMAVTGALAKVAHTGAYGDLSGTPSIPSTNGLDTVAAREAAVAASTQTIAGASVSGAIPYATSAGTATMATNANYATSAATATTATNALQLGGIAAANYLTNNQSSVTLSGTFSGTGTGLTGLDAGNISAGTVGLARLSGITTNQMAETEKAKVDAAVTNSQSGVTLSGTFSGNGSGLTTLNASNLDSGTVPLARLSGVTSNQMDSATDAAYRNAPPGVTNHAELSNLSYAGSGHTGFQPAGDYLTNSQAGVTLSGTFSGNGAGVTNLDAGNLAAGTVALARLSGITTNQMAETERIRIDQAVTNGQTNVTLSGTFGGNGENLSSLNASSLDSGTVPLARLSGITSNQVDATTDAAYRYAPPGVTNHAELSNLAYASSGHTGFQAAGDYVTNGQSGVTLSGTFSGTGSGLTGLTADNLSAGTVALARLSGITTNQMAETERIRIDQAVTNGQTGVTLAGTTTLASLIASSSVGVGTNSPQATLDVNGTARFQSGITFIPRMGDLSMGSFTNGPAQ